MAHSSGSHRGWHVCLTSAPGCHYADGTDKTWVGSTRTTAWSPGGGRGI